jgi:hypothetical protein
MTPELLGEIPRLIEPIMKHFRRVRVESCKGNKQGPYIVVRNESVSKKLTLSHEKISYPMIPVAENIIFLAQWFATTTGKNATVAFPAPGDFVICFRQETQGEVVVLYKVDVAGVSAAVDECKELEDPPNVTSLQILSG